MLPELAALKYLFSESESKRKKRENEYKKIRQYVNKRRIEEYIEEIKEKDKEGVVINDKIKKVTSKSKVEKRLQNELKSSIDKYGELLRKSSGFISGTIENISSTKETEELFWKFVNLVRKLKKKPIEIFVLHNGTKYWFEVSGYESDARTCFEIKKSKKHKNNAFQNKKISMHMKVNRKGNVASLCIGTDNFEEFRYMYDICLGYKPPVEMYGGNAEIMAKLNNAIIEKFFIDKEVIYICFFQTQVCFLLAKTLLDKCFTSAILITPT